ncbi:uncharacterized protein LOC105801137 [Gossypium raimondii]|uniref:uncharacterized protein LOC105801137 n=1 Tax=Gossypium raimondii TaxID=29730 RepID=UPI00063AFD06|nr:uncharacterized protein LOC105801137 [Gossypium raimondii]
METPTNSPNLQFGALVLTQALNQNSMLSVADNPPTIKEGEVDDVTAFTTVEAWEHSDFLCRNYILNGLSDALYEVYSVKKTAKKLSTSLGHKYKPEDVGAKKFLVAKFLNFVMVDSKLLVNQVQELQLIIHGIFAEGMVISESFQVAVIIQKLPPAWNNFKNYLKHTKKEMSVEDLSVRLQIEENNRGTGKNLSKAVNVNGAKTNMIGHKSSNCKLPKKVRANEANVVEEISNELSDLDLCVVIFEINMVESNTREWQLDTSAIHHICCNKDSCSELVPCDKREKLYISNVETSKIKGKSTVVLKMTYGKELKFQNVLYVPDICKNLVSGTFLSVHDFKMVFESQKLILSKGGTFVGRGYILNDM